MADPLDVLFAENAVEQKEPVKEQAQSAPEPKPESVKAEEPKPEVPAPAPSPKPADQPHAPIAALLDERDKRQRAERERDDLRARLQPEKIPSIQDDPDGYVEHMRQETARAATNTRFEISEVMAAEKHGEPVVKAAMEWGMQRSQESPAFAAEYLKQKHPVDWVVRQQKREGMLKDIGDDPDAYVRRRWAELNPQADPAQTPAAPIAAQPQPAAIPKPAPPRSLVHAPNAGSGTQSIPMGPGSAFDAAIPR